jgi:hypothetical protein
MPAVYDGFAKSIGDRDLRVPRTQAGTRARQSQAIAIAASTIEYFFAAARKIFFRTGTGPARTKALDRRDHASTP